MIIFEAVGGDKIAKLKNESLAWETPVFIYSGKRVRRCCQKNEDSWSLQPRNEGERTLSCIEVWEDQETRKRDQN